LGTLLIVLVVALVLAALIGAGGYSYRRYWSPAGSEVVETGGETIGPGAGIAAAVLALLVLIVLFFGFTTWNRFGTRPTAPAAPAQNPTVSSPLPGAGAGTNPSPSAPASPSK
jgi:hypothetical protein